LSFLDSCIDQYGNNIILNGKNYLKKNENGDTLNVFHSTFKLIIIDINF